MSLRWMTYYAPLVAGVAVGLLCASCESEAKVNPTSKNPQGTSHQPKRTVVFVDDIERIRIEAEAAEEITSDDCLNEIPGKLMRIVANEEASGGKCIEVPDKAGKPYENGKFATAVYSFTIEKPGRYTFWLRRWWKDQCGDTVAVRFDMVGQPRNKDTEHLVGADDSSQPPRWDWSPVWQKGKPRQFFFTAGEHKLEIVNREDGPRFDVLLLTNDRDYVPQGLEE